MSDEGFFARGKRSVVYFTNYNNVRAVKKIAKPRFVSNLRNEAYRLLVLNKHKIGPKLFCFGNDFIVMEFIDGSRILDFFKVSNKKQILKVLREIFLQCRKLDVLLVDKKELTNPYKHIIVRKGKPVMIDFERCRNSRNPKNITQFIQFLTSKKVSSLFADKNIKFDIAKFRALAKNYKKYHKNFHKILAFLN